jgi:hypothetical protein
MHDSRLGSSYLTLDEVLQIEITVFEAEAQEKKKRSRVFMLVQVLENLVTLIGSCKLACRKAVGPNPLANVRQEDSRHSKYIAHSRDADCRTGPCFVMMAVDRDSMLNTAIS